MRKQGSCLEKDNARNNARCTAWMDNIKTWTGLSVEESVRMTEDRDKWRKYVHGSRTAEEQNGINGSVTLFLRARVMTIAHELN